ncbi:MAG: hypothetical protein GY783_13050 [Gammaproteobacteria bacterium]|nr:hypothetical protein [Gammaproteobacteria bacterium]
MLGKGNHVMTIPGTSRLENLKINLGAYEIGLTDDELTTLDHLADRVKDERYDERGMSIING